MHTYYGECICMPNAHMYIYIYTYTYTYTCTHAHTHMYTTYVPVYAMVIFA